MAVRISREDAFTCCACDAFADGLSACSTAVSLDHLVVDARRIWWREVRPYSIASQHCSAERDLAVSAAGTCR
jgi:hypothetical protein